MTEERKAQQNLRIVLIIVSLAILMLTLTAGYFPDIMAEEKSNSMAPVIHFQQI